jgi:hypothetical protein
MFKPLETRLQELSIYRSYSQNGCRLIFHIPSSISLKILQLLNSKSLIYFPLDLILLMIIKFIFQQNSPINLILRTYIFFFISVNCGVFSISSSVVILLSIFVDSTLVFLVNLSSYHHYISS